MIWKDSRKNSTGNEKIDQYTLYIINSLEMAAEFCYERYMDDHNLDKNVELSDLCSDELMLLFGEDDDDVYDSSEFFMCMNKKFMDLL